MSPLSRRSAIAYDLARDPRGEHPNPLGHARPDLVVAKKPAKSAAGGFIRGGLVGAAPGTIVGMILFGGLPAILVIVCFTVAGSILGGAFGGSPRVSSRPLLGKKSAGL